MRLLQSDRKRLQLEIKNCEKLTFFLSDSIRKSYRNFSCIHSNSSVMVIRYISVPLPLETGFHVNMEGPRLLLQPLGIFMCLPVHFPLSFLNLVKMLKQSQCSLF